MTTLSMHDLGLRSSQPKALGRKARRTGKTAPEYVRALIERHLLLDKSFDEILAPIREDFRESGITQDQPDRMVDHARGARQRGKRGARR